jgi:hypothetical protein
MNVALIIFNQLNLTEQVLAEIVKARPPRMFLTADGPREGRPEEAERCVATRAVIDGVDLDCEVAKNYSDANVGCRRGRRPESLWSLNTWKRRSSSMVPAASPEFFRFFEERL